MTGHLFEKERTELVERYEGQIKSLRQELTRLQEKLEEEREVLAQRFDQEKEGIEEQLAQQLRDELEVRNVLSFDGYVRLYAHHYPWKVKNNICFF